MEYPLQIDVNITQDDYIQVEILEQELEKKLLLKETKKTFIIETIIMAVVVAGVALINGPFHTDSHQFRRVVAYIECIVNA